MDIQQSGSWNHEREEGEDEQVVQPKIKRKRSIRLRPRHTIERPEERYCEKMSLQRGDPSQSHCLTDQKFGSQLRIDPESKTVGDSSTPKQDQSDMSSKTRRTLPSRRTGSTSKLHASSKPGRLNSLSNPSDEAGENSRDSWEGNRDVNTSGNSSYGAKMSDIIQRRVSCAYCYLIDSIFTLVPLCLSSSTSPHLEKPKISLKYFYSLCFLVFIQL